MKRRGMSGRDTARVFYKRPLLAVAVSVALGVALGRYLHLQVYYISAAALFGVAAVLLQRFRKRAVSSGRLRKPFVLMCAACALCGAFLSANLFDVCYAETGDNMAVTGRVASAPQMTDSGNTIVMLDNAALCGQPCGDIKMYVREDSTKLAPGDVISTTADVEVPKGVRNPGGFDERLYLLTNGVHYKAFADSVQVNGRSGGLVVWAAQARTFLGNTVDGVFAPDTAPVAKAMLLGDKRSLDAQTYSVFKDTGMAHILAVSGLHAGILIAFVYRLMRLLRSNRSVRLATTLVFIAVYAVVTGMTPSIMRASIMAISLLLGRYFGRQSDTLNYLSIAFILSLLINPADLFSVGFQLSFGAVFGILTLGWHVTRWLHNKLPDALYRVGDAVGVTVGATTGTIPVLAAAFNRIATFSVLTNVFIVPFATVTIVLVFIASLVGMAFAPAAAPFALLASVFIRIINAIVGGVASVPFAAVDVTSPAWFIVLGAFVVLMIASKYVLIKTWLKTVIISAVCVVVAAASLLGAHRGLYMVFLDVGQGDAAFIRTEQGGEYFIDGGDEGAAAEVVDFTIRNGYVPEAAFVSHPDADHISGVASLYEAGLVRRVYCARQAEDAVRKIMPDADVVPLSAGDTVLLDETTSVLVLYPYADSAAELMNELSLVLRITYRGRSALFTGDITGELETQLFADAQEVDVYKAAHHGSKSSSYALPLTALSPRYSVVSVGCNTYGHPHEWAMKNLEVYSDAVYTTQNDHAVAFYVDDGIRVQTYGEKDGTN